MNVLPLSANGNYWAVAGQAGFRAKYTKLTFKKPAPAKAVPADIAVAQPIQTRSLYLPYVHTLKSTILKTGNGPKGHRQLIHAHPRNFTNFAAGKISLTSGARWRRLRHMPKHQDHT